VARGKIVTTEIACGDNLMSTLNRRLLSFCWGKMLRRQRTILQLLNTTDRSVSLTQLQKLLFLLRAETFVSRDGAFYEFLPYKFGPYSFAAAREVESLIAYGYIESAVSASSTSLIVTALGMREGKVIIKWLGGSS
jgi:uncharacterized protein YwgA